MGHDEAEDYQGRTAIHRAIMPVLAQLNPKRRFLLSSPYGGALYASKTVGTTHNTQYLGSVLPYVLDTDMVDYKAYFATYLARFIAEEPTLGAVSLPSLRRIMSDADIFGDDEMWNYHMKGNPGLSVTLFDLLQTFAKKVLGPFVDGTDRLFKLKYAQFEWVRISMENFRRNSGFINGLIYWMWNDCWPASAGWAFVDYYCLPKASYYAFRRCAGGLLASVHKSDQYDICLCNDTLQERQVRLTLSCLSGGIRHMLGEQNVTVPAQWSGVVDRLPLSALPEGAVLLCDAAFDGGFDRAFYREGTLPLVPCAAPQITARTEHSITLTAAAYIHAVELEGEYVFDDNYFSLFPGESRTVQFRPAPQAQTTELTLGAYTIAAVC